MLPTIDLAALFDASPYPYLLISPDLTLLDANRAYLAATGRTADEVVGQHLFAVFPSNPDDPASTNTQEAARSIAIAVETRRPHTCPLLRYAVARDTPAGRTFEDRYWSVSHTPVLDAAGEVMYVSQNAIDVTDLYRFDRKSRRYVLREEAHAVPDVAEFSGLQLHEAMKRILCAERNQLQSLFDQAPGFIAVLMGPDCVFDTVNRAYYDFVGQRELLGRPVLEALPELAGQGFEEIFASVLQTGAPVVVSGRRVVVQRDSDGSQEERFVDLLYQPIFDGDGRVIGIFNQGHDVTTGHVAQRVLAEKLGELAEERRRSAFQLRLADRLRPLNDPAEIFRESGAQISAHFDASRVAYGEYHRQQKKLTIHSQFEEGAEVPTLVAKAVAFQPGDVDVIEDGGIWVSDDLFSDPRTVGPETWETFHALQVHAAVVVPLTRHGPTIACLFVGTAIPKTWLPSDLELLKEAADRVWTAAERVRAEAALRLADERKDQFLAMLAHELRNPLAPIRAAADIQRLAPDDAARIRTTSAIISRQVTHMTSLVEDLLDVSRVTGGLVTLGQAQIDINDVLSAALEQVRPMVHARRHQVAVRLPHGSALVCGDEKRLVQIFANVLNNAAKYTPEGGRIEVETEVSAETVVVTVSDNGIGMSAEVVRSAFDLFSQAERTPDRAQGGLGIGLALVKRLVEQHHGTVSAASAGADMGSQLVISLPRLRAARQAGVQTVTTPPIVTAPLQVLVVDDNQDAALTIAMLVEAYGHRAVVAHDAQEGLRRALDQPPDICLLDLGLPGMDGFALATELRRIAATADATLIAVTGYGQAEDRRRTADAGFDHHLVKPVDAAVLTALLAAAGPARARVT